MAVFKQYKPSDVFGLNLVNILSSIWVLANGHSSTRSGLLFQLDDVGFN